MPMDQPEMERRITQNTNDILSVYDMLSGIDATLAKHTIQLANLATKIDAHDGRFDSVDASLTEILRRLPG